MILLTFLSSFLLVALAMPTLIQVAVMKNLVDDPGDLRKIHKRSVPTIGGVMVILGFLLSTMGWMPLAEGKTFEMQWMYMLSASLALFFVGLKDDLIGLSPSKKLMVHVFLGALLIHWGGFRITTFDGLFGLTAIPLAVSYIFSLFVYIVVVNAVNLIDGIDGLAGGVGTLMMLAFASIFYASGHTEATVVALALAGALVGFLVHNFHPAKIFMGDSGSLVLGLVSYSLVTEVMNLPAADVPQALNGLNLPLIGMSILAYPLVDTLRVFTLRALKGRSPFSPDKNHLHHRLMMLGIGHRGASIALYLYTTLFILLPFALHFWVPGLDQTLVFSTELILAFVLFLPILRRTRFAHKRDEVRIKVAEAEERESQALPEPIPHPKPVGRHAESTVTT